MDAGRRKWAILMSAGLIAPMMALVAAAPAQAAGTQVSVTVTMADGVTPMTSAEVDVFYVPTNPGDSYTGTLMGSGTTDSSGIANITLDTSMVSDLGDIGDGNNNAFNTDIAVFGASGANAEDYAILTLGSDTPVPMTQDTTDGSWTANPNPGDISDSATHVDTAYNYVPVLAENSGAGMKAQFKYTYNSSTTRQTSVNAIFSPDGSAPWSVGAFLQEKADRQYQKGWDATGSYHYYVWVNYSFWKWKTQICGIRGCLHVKYKWELNRWTGDITDNNPDPACNGCTQSVGQVPYNVPPYTTNYNYTVALTPNSPDAIRASTISHTYGFYADFGGFVTINSKASYGNITWVKWSYVAPASLCGQDRLLWGNGYTVPDAPIVQANCFKRPSP